MSRVAHARVLARTDRGRSFEMLLTALGTDLANPEHSSTRNGIHLGATAGTLDILQRCYTGLEVSRPPRCRRDGRPLAQLIQAGAQLFCGKPRFTPPWDGSSHRLVTTLDLTKKFTPSGPYA
ncbi:hypothetical protein [Micromonospora sp. NPDC005087]|uniref:hypothetical protein n=1 Tax=Micromonospora sp. NPDC005087 TaxID=3364225 RepID=UPI003694C475